MDFTNHHSSFEQDINKLKVKYQQEMRDSPDNPIKICMKLVFDSATEKDPTKRLELSLKLSEFLIQPNGVINLFLALIDFDTSSQKLTTLNQRFIAVANIITCLPKISISYQDYCKNISQQLTPLLISENPSYSSLASIIVKSMIKSHHARCESITKVILDPIFAPLTSNIHQLKTHEAILAIHNLILNHLPIDLFISIFPNIFHILVQLHETPSRLKSILKETLVMILNGLKPGPACCLLEQTMFYDEQQPFYERCNEGEEISVKFLNCDKKNKNTHHSPKVIQAIVVSLIEEAKNDLLTLEFFFHFKETMWSATDSKSRQLSALIIEPLLKETIEEKSTAFDLIGIIATNTNRTLELITRILLNYIAFLKYHPEEYSDRLSSINQSVGSCLSILEVLSVMNLEDGHTQLIRDRCLPVLDELRTLLVIQEEENQKNLYKTLNNLYLKLKQADDAKAQSIDHHSQDHKDYDIILKDLNDKLVPVRVHALIKLKQMIMINNHYVVSQIPQLFKMIEHTIADQEPYVFLASINLLAEMVVRKTNELLPKLVSLYSSKELDLQHRMNIGEVLVRLSKQLNQTTPFYAQQVMSELLRGCSDTEELMRMSSLTNIGQLSQNLGHSLGNYIMDILHCIESIFLSDTIQVKCAAVELLRTTLMGLDKYKIESIQRELKSIYNILKKLRQRTLDEKFCQLVDLALDEVDRIAREMLHFDVEKDQDNKLVKNIKLLSLLD